MLQSPEGGFLSVGNRRFRIRRSVTPPLTPVSVRPLEGVPVTMPANMLTERIPPPGSLVEVLDAGRGHRQDHDLEERALRALPDDLCLRHRDDPGDRPHACPRERSAGDARAGTGRPADDADRASGEARSGGSRRRATAAFFVPCLVAGPAPSSGCRRGGRPTPPCRREVRGEGPRGSRSLICRRAPFPRRAADRRRACPSHADDTPQADERDGGERLFVGGHGGRSRRDPAMPAPTKKKWVDPFDQ